MSGRTRIKNRYWGNPASSGVPVLGDQTLEWGRLTLVNHGATGLENVTNGYDSITLGTRSTGADHFEVNGPDIRPKAVPSNTTYVWDDCTCSNGQGTSDPFQLTINTDADTYECGTDELATIIAQGAATISGKTIKCRPGADICGTTPGDNVTISGNLSAELIIESRDASPGNRAFARRMDTTGSGPLTLRGIDFRDDMIDADIPFYSTISLLSIDDATDLVIDDCTFSGDEDRMSAAVTDSVVTFDGGTNTVSWPGHTLINGQRVSFQTDGSLPSPLTVVTSYFVISANQGAGTFKISNSSGGAEIDFSGGSGTHRAGAFVNLTMIRVFDTTNRPSIEIIDTTFTNYLNGIVAWATSFSLLRCTFDNGFADHVNYSIHGDETLLRAKDCWFQRTFSKGTEPQDPHCDITQIMGLSQTAINTVPFEFIGNKCWTGPNSRGHICQGFFCSNVSAPFYVKVFAEHNVYLGGAQNALAFDRAATGSIIRGNTLLFDQAGDALMLPPSIFFNDPESAPLIEYNVCPFINATATEVGNHEFGTGAGNNDNTDYLALFTASDFDSDSFASRASFLAGMTPLDTPTLRPANGVRIGALQGYYDYDTGISDAPWDEAGFTAANAFTDQTGVATTTVITSNEVTMTGISATGALVRISGSATPQFRIRDGSNNLIRDFSSAEAVILNGYKLTLRQTSSGSGSTAVTATVRIGSVSNTDTWSVTTA